MDDFLVALTLVTALGCGLAGGALFAFSSFVMKALARLPAPQGIAAMNSINVVVVNPVFMTALFGTGAACLALIVYGLADWGDYSPYLLAGGAIYLLGTPGVTMAFNVPRNLTLAKVDPADADAAGTWARYVSEWTNWNHVRVVAAVVASALLIGAINVG